jgi:hypothetical protein
MTCDAFLYLFYALSFCNGNPEFVSLPDDFPECAFKEFCAFCRFNVTDGARRTRVFDVFSILTKWEKCDTNLHASFRKTRFSEIFCKIL